MYWLHTCAEESPLIDTLPYLLYGMISPESGFSIQSQWIVYESWDSDDKKQRQPKLCIHACTHQ